MVRDEDTAHEAVPVSDPTREPVKDPVIGAVRLLSCNELEMVPTGSPDGSTNEAVVALDEDTAQEAVPVKDPTNEPVNDPVMGAVRLLSCNELESVPAGSPDGRTNEAVIALDDDAAQLEVPSTEPVNPLPLNTIPLDDIKNEPVMTALPVNGNPGVAFNANDAVVAVEAETAQLLVPKNDPL
jgi:hypothetical protein